MLVLEHQHAPAVQFLNFFKRRGRMSLFCGSSDKSSWNHKTAQYVPHRRLWHQLSKVLTINYTNVSQTLMRTNPHFSSVAQSWPTLCNPMNCSPPGLPVHHKLPEFTQTHVHWVSDAILPSHTLSSPFPPAPNPSQHQSLFQWVNSSHEGAKVLEFQL